jgi:hypothetical protein
MLRLQCNHLFDPITNRATLTARHSPALLAKLAKSYTAGCPGRLSHLTLIVMTSGIMPLFRASASAPPRDLTVPQLRDTQGVPEAGANTEDMKSSNSSKALQELPPPQAGV